MTDSIVSTTRTIRISGIGETDFMRGTDRSANAMLLEAAASACADAGVETSAVDAVVVPNAKIDPEALVHGLGIADLRFHAASLMGGAATMAAVNLAAGAIRGGLAERVLVVAGGTQYSGAARINSATSRFTWPGQHIRDHLETPYGLSAPMQWYALMANHWIEARGGDPGALEQVALATRRHAHRNPKAWFRDRPLSAEDYRAAPMLVDPFRLYDVCLESDGAAAVLLEAAERPAGNDHRAVHVLAGAEGHASHPDDLLSRPDPMEIGLSRAAPRAFAQAGLRAEEIDLLQLYDCFSITVLLQLEALGLCAPGEAGELIAERGIGPGGRLPVNTHGGLLSQAHIAGMNHLTEAVRQLRGTAGDAQVPDVRTCAVTGYGDMADGSLVLLGN